jgi:hypothetical protein
MAQNIEFKKSICLLAHNKKFMSLALSYGAVNGTYNFYGSLLGDILDPYGFSSKNISNFGSATMIAGIFATGLFCLYV